MLRQLQELLRIRSDYRRYLYAQNPDGLSRRGFGFHAIGNEMPELSSISKERLMAAPVLQYLTALRARS